MEPTDQFALKRAAYAQAVRGFVELLEVDLSPFDAKIVDGLQNGQAQKFEYTTELTWKIVRRYLLLHDAIEANSPKSAIKEFYALRGGNCPDWIVPSGMQCKAQIAPCGHSHTSNLQRGSAPAGGNPTGQFPPHKA